MPGLPNDSALKLMQPGFFFSDAAGAFDWTVPPRHRVAAAEVRVQCAVLYIAPDRTLELFTRSDDGKMWERAIWLSGVGCFNTCCSLSRPSVPVAGSALLECVEHHYDKEAGSERRVLARRWSEGSDLTHAGYEAARAWFLGELGEQPADDPVRSLGGRLLVWAAGCVMVAPHVCSGERVDNGRHESSECDDSDSPRCPQYRPAADERCARCDVRKFNWVRVGGWYCDNCWNERRLA